MLLGLELIKRQSSSLVNWRRLVSRSSVGLSHHNMIHMKLFSLLSQSFVLTIIWIPNNFDLWWTQLHLGLCVFKRDT